MFLLKKRNVTLRPGNGSGGRPCVKRYTCGDTKTNCFSTSDVQPSCKRRLLMRPPLTRTWINHQGPLQSSCLGRCAGKYHGHFPSFSWCLPSASRALSFCAILPYVKQCHANCWHLMFSPTGTHTLRCKSTEINQIVTSSSECCCEPGRAYSCDLFGISCSKEELQSASQLLRATGHSATSP